MFVIGVLLGIFAGVLVVCSVGAWMWFDICGCSRGSLVTVMDVIEVGS